jgi:hypothetical protein
MQQYPGISTETASDAAAFSSQNASSVTWGEASGAAILKGGGLFA